MGVNTCYELNSSQCQGYTTLAVVCVHAATDVWLCVSVFVSARPPTSAACQGLLKAWLLRQGFQLKDSYQPVKDRGEDTYWLWSG